MNITIGFWRLHGRRYGDRDSKNRTWGCSDDDLDAVAKFATNTEHSLQASVWAQNLKVAHPMARKIKAGTICINSHNDGDRAWPSDGHKQPGPGREMT